MLYVNAHLFHLNFIPCSLFYWLKILISGFPPLDDLSGHTSPVLALLPHIKPWLTCYQESLGHLLDNEEQKNIYHGLALRLTSNLSNYFHAAFIIRPWPFMPCTFA